jgi:aminobenzoyl-glutamate utilization protein B
VIAFLGEYDALAGLSQEADAFEPASVTPGANGHGCGHNMLGAASMLAAAAVKDWLAETGTPGRVRYYGCPAEEGGAAKTFMVRDGAFDDVDIAISWHPDCLLSVMEGSSLANCRIDFTFTGKASHAAASPHLGRSALDAVELTSVGVNYMREHMPQEARIHYALIDGGGVSPNVVQARAKVRYVVRDATAPKMLALLERVRNVAEGAALMTGTRVEAEVLAAVSNVLPNPALMAAMQRNLDRLGPPEFDAEDRAYAEKIQATLSVEEIAAAYEGHGLRPEGQRPLCDFVVPGGTKSGGLGGSTDVADVSWVVPTVQLWGANYAIGTPFHSWQMVTQGKSRPAVKGMIHAAMVMAATGADALRDAGLRAAAAEDLRQAAGPGGYVCPLPEGSKPPIAAMAGKV